jgi:RNA methyltransferase, TrmH family
MGSDIVTAREAKELRALRTRGNRDRTGRFVAEGIRVVEDLLASDLTVHWVATASTLEDTPRGAALARDIDRRGIPCRTLDDRDLAEFAATDSPQGVLAVASIPTADLEAAPLAADRSVVLVLDAVQDPGNFGTLVRSAEALGASAVIALPGTVDPWNAKSVRSAAGSSFRVPIVQTGWESAAARLRERGFTLYGAAAEGSPLPGDRPARVALVVGNEGAGLTTSVREEVDALVKISLSGRAESLNVAAAAAILLYELTR